MTTEAKIDLTEIRDRLRRARRAEEPYDAADQWAALGGDVPALVDELARVRRAVLAVADDLDADFSARSEDEDSWRVSYRDRLRALIANTEESA